MIYVTVIKKSEQYRGLSVNGHAGYGNEGTDIICAAVSVLTINTINAIEKFTSVKPDATMEDGLIEANFPDKTDSDVKLLMDTYVLGIESIRDSYGDSYIHLEIKEV